MSLSKIKQANKKYRHEKRRREKAKRDHMRQLADNAHKRKRRQIEPQKVDVQIL